MNRILKYSVFVVSVIILLSPLATSMKNESIRMEKSDNLSSLMGQINESILLEYLYKIESFGPHPTGSEEIYNLGEYLYLTLESLGVSVEFDSWEYKDHYGRNIIAEIPGNGNGDGIVIVCAHYDSVAWSPGVDDDGSGIACVLEIARLIQHINLNASVRCILFDGEEQGLLGSHEYVEGCIKKDENIIGVLALDKIGYAPDKEAGSIIRLHASDESFWMREVACNVAKKYADVINLEVVPYGFDASSDHKSFVDNGFCGINLVEEALNPMYHTSFDIVEYINLSYLLKVCRLSFAMIASYAKIDNGVSEQGVQVNIVKNEFGWFSVDVVNSNEQVLDASIVIEMIHPIRDKAVVATKQYYSEPCSWSFDTQISQSWQFVFAGHTCTRGFVRIDVFVTGIDDDIGLFVKEDSFGLIVFPWRLWMT